MSLKVFDRIEPVSKKDRILSTMREAIIQGQMNPGDPIVESKLAQQFNVGQPLVREALIELEYQGFVQRLPYRATHVTKLSRTDIEQAFRIRIELEALAIEWAKPHIKADDLKELRELVKAMKQGARSMNLTQFYENDLAMHRKIWELSGNRYLVEALERIVVPLFAFFLMKTRRIKDSYVESAMMHERIVEAIPTMDAAELRQLQINTLGEFKGEMLTKLLPEDG